MKKILVTIGLSLVLASCASDEVRQSSTDVLQRRQIEQENLAREARVKDEQAKLAQFREQQRERDEAGKRASRSEIAVVVQPLEATGSDIEPLEPPGSMPESVDSAIAKRAIYYAYDAYNVAEEYGSLVEAHGKFLLAHKDRKLRIEGNCDDRGSREYNLALGQRRADSVKRALTLMGVPARQIQTVSFGSEKPKRSDQSEQAYAENRRADLLYMESNQKSR